MSVVMLELLPPSAAPDREVDEMQEEERQAAAQMPVAPRVAPDAVVMLDDVEVLGAYARCNCEASDDNPY
ncbi:hypothetical protein UK23_11365 [Lentzea aerocolonigenes]|uniref:Uncharacterized protein n=1 Tax=Lentzea aerocolonigenes TaxID=68170 RepID=A0A0F0H427_LENAE|nr:hypothetical protein [Lentzea aerocolonigenes]KJK50265.1 hypothetical protein UK23_11365 [Lentzea aerocolonigenes]